MKKILSIDGGGIRGMIPALMLNAIEKETDRPIATMFDMIAGTSVGSMIALGLCVNDGNGKPKYSAEEIVELFEKRGRDIFHRSFWKGVSSVGGLTDEKYAAKGLEDLMKEYMGDEPLGSALTNILVSSYDIQNRVPFFFKSWRRERQSVLMRQVVRAATAAPLFFEPALVAVEGSTRALIDGGVFVNNPAMCAFSEARREFGDEPCMVVSLGTGELTRPIPYDEAKDWGYEWAFPILSVVFDGVSDAVDYQMRQLLGDNFFRFQTALEVASDDLDNASPSNIMALKMEAVQILRAQKSAFETVCQRLKNEN